MEPPADLDTWTYETIVGIVDAYEYEPGFFDFKGVLNAPKAESREAVNQPIRKITGAL